LIIRFDPKCNTGKINQPNMQILKQPTNTYFYPFLANDMLTRVAFYRDEQYQDPIAIYRGRIYLF